jgi:hypothetical protein
LGSIERVEDYAEAGGPRTGVAERATACGVVRPRPANTIENGALDGELTATRTAACHDDDRLTVFSENSDPGRELTMASRPSDVRRLAQTIC